MAKKLKTKTEDIRKLNDADLLKELEESYRRRFALRLQKETLQLTNHRELPRMKHAIARLKTIQHEREIARALGKPIPAPAPAPVAAAPATPKRRAATKAAAPAKRTRAQEKKA